MALEAESLMGHVLHAEVPAGVVKNALVTSSAPFEIEFLANFITLFGMSKPVA